MYRYALHLFALGCCTAILAGGLLAHGNEPPRTGPATEKRFPPLKVPPGFKATLFACDPLIEYPSVIAAGPRPGAVFVAIDYMTGLGTEITKRSEIRLVEDTDGDGYADRATFFAGGFNSIQGLAYHDGTVYVMHAPYLTALRHTRGKAEDRRDLLTGLGLTPEQNPVRLHCANGVTVGHDGWLYLAMGDHGVDVPRPEGDRLVLRGGGILRCRPDGRDLHVFATGLRNIYDVALDAEQNVFVRDNENDGGTYMVRVCHSFHGADHGYPYLYEERPGEALPPLADLGLGSSAGGVCYLETQFPPEYRGNLLFCEWGRSVVRYAPRRAGSGFAPLKEVEFAVGDSKDTYPFRPTDIIVQSDGTLMVADYADGQRPKRGRGRIYHIAYTGAAAKRLIPKDKLPGLLEHLDSESYHERCQAQTAIKHWNRVKPGTLTDALRDGGLDPRGRMHALWALTRTTTANTPLVLALAKSDPDPAVRAQAVRAVADLSDPVLVEHKLDAGRGDVKLAEQLAALAKGQDPRVVLEIVVALGRLRWTGAPEWLRQNLDTPEAPLAHAAMQTLRRAANWPATLKLLDEPDAAPIRTIALRALADRYETAIVDELIARLGSEKKPGRRREYADTLTRVYKKPAPWKYWGYRPAPRPANTVAWPRSEAIEKALDRVLADSDRGVRFAALKRMQREKVPARLATLGGWLKGEHQPEYTAAILVSLAEQRAPETTVYLDAVVRDPLHSVANRLTALNLLAPAPWLSYVQMLEDGPVLAEVLRRAGKEARSAAAPIVASKLTSSHAEVRAAAIEALGELQAEAGRVPLFSLLADKDVRVRRAAAGAAGKLGGKAVLEPLLKLMADADPGVQRAGLDSLRRLREPRVVPLAVAALANRELESKALECLAELGGPAEGKVVAEFAKRNPSLEATTAVVRMLTAWRGRKEYGKQPELDGLVAEVHGASGILARWSASGPVSPDLAPKIVEQFWAETTRRVAEGWRTLFATGAESRVGLAPKGANALWFAYTDLTVAEAAEVEFLSSSKGGFQVWLNGRSLHRRDKDGTFQIDSDRFTGKLERGPNRLLVQAGAAAGPVEFHLRFRRKSAKASHEKLTQAALTRGGSPVRGRKIFFDAEKSQCIKCHRLADQGERIGPELTGVGSRFSRIYVVESILEPSRTIAPSFATYAVSLKSGKQLIGVKLAETETMLTLADNLGKKHELAKADIDEQHPSPISTMPEGLEQRLTEDEFVDLIAFLMSQKATK